ncbi:hypothetical protein [Photobacterium kishitanii]|uniref:hypothetical protein n=1 Tax=Photobacterium kishitanii TaxID=318456 RepID=UPI002738F398|nr:hypothetical protein [Photobacterium kishitanii]
MRNFIKNVISLIARFVAWYYIISYFLNKNYKLITLRISDIDGYIGFEIRRFFYNKTLKTSALDLRVHKGAYFVYPNVSVGRRCSIEENTVISLCDIGDDVIIAANVSLMSGGISMK